MTEEQELEEIKYIPGSYWYDVSTRDEEGKVDIYKMNEKWEFLRKGFLYEFPQTLKLISIKLEFDKL